MSTFKKKFPTFDEAGYSVGDQLKLIIGVNDPEEDDENSEPLGDFCIAAKAFKPEVDNSDRTRILRDDPTLRWMWSRNWVSQDDIEDAFDSEIEDENVVYGDKDKYGLCTYITSSHDNTWDSYVSLHLIQQDHAQRFYACEIGFEEDQFGKVTNPKAFSKADLINKIMRVLGVDINDAATRTNLEGFSQAQLFRKLQQKETYLADSQEEYLSLLPLEGFDNDVLRLDISQLGELINAAYEKIYPPFDEDLDDFDDDQELITVSYDIGDSFWKAPTSDLAWEDDIHNPHNT